METKLQIAKNFLFDNIKIFRCPKCHTNLKISNNSLICNNNHNFDFNKKGMLCLLNTGNLKKSKIYNKNLFINRKQFLMNKFYDNLHIEIKKIIENEFNNKKITIMDLGSGEGTHVIKSINIDNCNLIGFDYSKDAIDLATDYMNTNIFYFVGDVNNIPVTDKSIDCIIDILSPYNEKEINRILKKNGIFIKVVPGKNYLKELRESYSIKEYEENKLIEKKYKNLQKIEINDTFMINSEELKYLINMTPMEIEFTKKNIDSITINMIIYVMKESENNV